MSERELGEQMERYRSGEMPEEEARRFEGRILSDDGLSNELYDDVSLERSLQESARGRSRRIARPMAWLIPLAAAALVILAVQLQRSGPAEPPVLRGSGQGVELIAPIGPQEVLPTSFRWRPYPQAQSYRFELMDSQAKPVFQAVVEDTLWSPSQPEFSIPTVGSWHLTPLDGLMMDLAPASTASYRVQP